MLNFDYTMIYLIPTLLLAMAIHEYAHAAVAYSLGDPTPKYMGRLTMNPLVHVDFLGLLLFFFAGFGWAKPVQVDTTYLKNARKDMMTISLAGPAANLLLAFIATFLYVLLTELGLLNNGLHIFLRYLQLYNIWFAIFNMFPFPPLDGFKVLTGILPGKQAYSLMAIEPYTPIIFIVLIITGVIGKVIKPVSDFVMGSMFYFVDMVLGVFF